jgi:oligoribonuclease (3'-5' exoribonuclease)
MLGDLFVVFKAQISGFVNKVKNMLGVTQGAAQKINASAKEMEGALTSAFSGQLRNNISNLSENISLTREKIVNLKDELKFLISEQKNLKQGTEAFKETGKAIDDVKNELFEAQQELTEFNIAARDNKKALADSRLAAEDNSAAIEATSRAVNAASSVVLLLGDNFEGLKPVLKGVSVAMALVNSAVVIQNLRLRENAVLANLATRSQNLLRTAFVGTSVATTALKSAIAGIGIVALISAVAYLTSNYNQNNEVIKEQIRQYGELRDVRKSIISSSNKEANELERLKSALNDSNASLATKKSAYDRLVSLVPELTNYTYEEALSLGVLTEAIDLQTIAIQKRATTEAFASAVAKKQLEIFEEQNKTFDESRDLLSRATYAVKKYLNPLYSIEQDISEEKVFQLNQGEKIEKLQKDLLRYQDEYNKAITEELKIQGSLDALKKDKDKKIKKPKKEDLKQAVNEQEKLAILEAQLNGERLLLLQTTEEGRAKVINSTQDEILAIRKAFFLQSATAQALGQNESLAAWKQYQLDLVKAEEDKNNRLSKARDKDTDNAESNAQFLAELNQESLDGMIEMQEEKYAILSGALAKEYNDGLVSLQKYNENKLNAEIAYLEDLIKIKKAYGVFAIEEEKKLAGISVKQIEKAETEKERLLKQTNRVIQQEFRNLFESLANTYADAIVAIANGGDPLQTLFNGILLTVSSFMDSFGKAILSVGVALLQLDVALSSLNPFLAIAGGIALIAAAGVAKSMAQKGVTPFADGGIVSGPTLGLVGEYPGASTNPEVIAPLNKLKSLIGGTGDGDGFVAETRISGRDLAIVLNRYNKDNARG